MTSLTLLLLLSLLLTSFLLPSPTSAFNPYEEDDDKVGGVVPETSTLQCTKDATTGEEKCESIAKLNIPEEEVLAEKVAKAEAEREEAARIKAEARAAREAKLQAEKEAKAEKRRLEKEAKKEQKEHKRKSEDEYKNIKAPLRKLKVDYYTFFKVKRDATTLQIRKAANTLSLANHPDKCDTIACKENMIVINEARDVLLDEETRKKYDFLLNYCYKIYDEELWKDMDEQYRLDPDDMPHDCPVDAHDPTSDYSAMNVTHEGAGWLLLLTGSLTAAMMAWPIIKFWESSQTAEAKKAALKKEMLATQAKVKQEMATSLKKKQEKYTGERGVKRFAEGSPQPANSPRKAASPSPSPKSGNGTTAQ